MDKPRIIKDFEKLDVEIQEQIKLQYPYGFARNLITFKNAKGEFVSALLFETSDKYYLVRMTKQKAQQIIDEDDDYDDDGILKDDVKLDYSEKYEGEGFDELEEDETEEEDIDNIDDIEDVEDIDD